MTGIPLSYFQNIGVSQENQNLTCKTDSSTHKTAVAEPEDSTTQVRKLIIDHDSSQYHPSPILAPALCKRVSSFYFSRSPTDTSSNLCLQGRWQDCEKRVLPSSYLSAFPHRTAIGYFRTDFYEIWYLNIKFYKNRISIVRWAWSLGNTSSPHWNPSRSLLHAVQPSRNHGQKPSRTMYRVM